MIATNGSIAKSFPDDAAVPTDIEALLPWHAVGRLAPKDARAVEDALRKDPALARQFAVIQDEVSETIHLNESLGVPSARAMQKLMAAIDAEPVRSASVSADIWARLNNFVAGLSPKALAMSAAAAAALVLVQAGALSVLLTKPSANYQTASYQAPPAPQAPVAAQAPRAEQMARTAAAPAPVAAAGPRALVRFAADATVSDITAFLDAYKASIVAGPSAGMFRIQFNDPSLAKDRMADLLARVQTEKVVSLAVAAD